MKIKVLGDSIAAGAGCSTFVETAEILMDYPEKQYFRCEAPTSWWGLLLDAGHEVKNMGCCGANSTQLLEHLDQFLEEEDELILVLVGLNDRKRVNGMNELRENLAMLMTEIKRKNKRFAFMTPLPSTYENEHFENRIHHTEEVVSILREQAEKHQVQLIDHYAMASAYLLENGKQIEDILFGEGCKNDGLHPGDFAQRLLYENIVQSGILSV